ncbi:hypothetical protein GCM10028818_26070 [Spirosoma horti]
MSENVESLEAISFKHQQVSITYQFDFSPDPNGYMAKNYDIGIEKTYHYRHRYELRSDDNLTFVDTVKDDWFTDATGAKLDIEVLGGHRREFFDFKLTKIFRPDPTKLVQQVKFSAENIELLADCSNLISFYYYVDSNFKRSSKRIQNDLSKCIPEIAYFTLPPVKVGNESMLGLRFFDKGDNGYWADEVSEGTLYFLALLCIINQPNPPKLLLLEEPEKGIHPRRIFEVIQFIFRLAEEKDVQVIMTTHSPIVVDMFKDMPESVFIFDKDDEGATHVKNLQHDVIEPETTKSKELGIEPPHYTDSLGDAWTVGFLGGVPK